MENKFKNTEPSPKTAKEEIEKLTFRNFIIHHYILQSKIGAITYEEALERAVLHLVDLNNKYETELTRLHAITPLPFPRL